MVASPFYLLADQVSSPFFRGVSSSQTEAWWGRRAGQGYDLPTGYPEYQPPKGRLVLGALLRAWLSVFGTLGTLGVSRVPTRDDQLSSHRLRSLPSRAHRWPFLPRKWSNSGSPHTPRPGSPAPGAAGRWTSSSSAQAEPPALPAASGVPESRDLLPAGASRPPCAAARSPSRRRHRGRPGSTRRGSRPRPRPTRRR